MKVCVIGGGPAGLMAAITARKKGYNVCIIEKNNIFGKKLNITGKGRCNITHSGDDEYFFDNVVTNSKFMMSSISNFNNVDLINFVNSLGVKTKKERGNRVFLASDNASEISTALYNEVKSLGINCIFNTSVDEILTKAGAVCGIKLSDGKEILADRIILATGGTSYPATGSDGKGYGLALRLGHSIVELKPALVPLNVYEQNICRELEGLSLKNISIQIVQNSKIIDERFGEAVFTANGMSGPIILSSSSKINKIKDLDNVLKNKELKLYVDLKPALTCEELYKRITRDFEKYKNKEYRNALIELLPKSIIPVIVELSEIDQHQQVNSITKCQKQKLVTVLKAMPFTIKSLGSIYTGIVTSGGISTKEINPKTMESKLISGLYFAGEVIDVDAYTGGFNLQIAFSTGYLAGSSV